jgi:hypothetical protein
MKEFQADIEQGNAKFNRRETRLLGSQFLSTFLNELLEKILKGRGLMGCRS